MFNASSVYKKRAARNQSEIARYSKFIFNGHFIVFLTIVIGALLLQYSQLLKHLPAGIDYHLIIGFVLAIAAIPPLRTFIQPADGVFLLAFEKELMPYMKKAILRSAIIRVMLWTILFVALLPLYWEGNHSLTGIIATYIFCVLSIYIGLYVPFLCTETRIR